MAKSWLIRGGAVLTALSLGLVGACGDDDDDPSEGSESTTTTEAADGDTIEVTASDYEFEGMPEVIAAGSKISLTTAEGGEPHEIVVVPKPAGEQRTVEELFELPPAELEALFAGEPTAVILALPGATDTPGAVVGDGTIAEPGNYIYLCSFPQGTTSEDVTSATGPLEGDGTPHFILGMRGEFKAE